jgi:replicative DNA helicase
MTIRKSQLNKQIIKMDRLAQLCNSIITGKTIKNITSQVIGHSIARRLIRALLKLSQKSLINFVSDDLLGVSSALLKLYGEICFSH